MDIIDTYGVDAAHALAWSLIAGGIWYHLIVTRLVFTVALIGAKSIHLNHFQNYMGFFSIIVGIFVLNMVR